MHETFAKFLKLLCVGSSLFGPYADSSALSNIASCKFKLKVILSRSRSEGQRISWIPVVVPGIEGSLERCVAPQRFQVSFLSQHLLILKKHRVIVTTAASHLFASDLKSDVQEMLGLHVME